MKIPFIDKEISLTWLWLMFLPYLGKFGPPAIEWMASQVPIIAALAPPPWDFLANGILMAIVSFIGIVVGIATKNKGVKEGKLTTVLGGRKAWNKKEE